MAAPIDEGRPVYNSRADHNFSMTNVTAAGRVYTWDPVADENEVEWAYGVTVPAGNIADGTNILLSATPTTTEDNNNIKIVNALTYKDKAINKVLLDFLFHQAHVGMLVKRLLPNGDAGVNAWIESSGSSDHYAYVDELFDAPATGNFLQTLTANLTEKFDLEAVPSNVVRVHEAFVMAWIAMTVGTDSGMGIQCVLTDSSDTPLGSLGTSEVLLDCQIDGTATARPSRGKMEALDTIASTFNGARLHVISKRGLAGGTPDPHWYLFAVEVMVYCEIDDLEIIDVASCTALDAECSTHLLRFSVWDGTYNSQLLDILSHKPSLFLYISDTGKLTFGQVQSYASVGSPLDLSPYWLGVERGPYRYTERSANVVELRWGITFSHINAATAQEDPVLTDVERGNRRLRRGIASVSTTGIESAKILDRHYIAGASNAAVARQCADEHLDLWGDGYGIEALDLRFSMRAIEAEPGSVVLLTIPEVGVTNRKFCVVSKEIDLDNDEVLLTVYDLEYTL